MIGRRVRIDARTGSHCVTVPLGAAMTDTLVEFDDGSRCWFASSMLKVADGAGPLPCRREARARADSERLASLERIRSQHVEAWHRPWPGAEFGKAVLGRSLDDAVQDVAARVAASKRRP